jgi:hypothetical protein
VVIGTDCTGIINSTTIRSRQPSFFCIMKIYTFNIIKRGKVGIPWILNIVLSYSKPGTGFSMAYVVSKENDLQIVGYRTPVFIQRSPWRLHITITYNLPHLWGYDNVKIFLSWGSNVKTAHIDLSFCVPSKSRDLADENNKILTEWKWFETTVLWSPWRLHITITYNLPHLWGYDMLTLSQ